MYRLYIFGGLMLATCGLCAANPTVCTPSPDLQAKLRGKPNADTYAEVGLWYGDHGKYACAIGAYQSALKQEPKSAEFLYSLGLNLIRHGDFREAINPLQQSIDIQPQVLKPHLLLATALEELHEPAQARTEWLAALKIDPHSEIALAGASKNLLAGREFEAVIGLLAPQPKGDDLTLVLAMAYKGVGQSDQAIEVLKKELEANPKSHAIAESLFAELVLAQRYQEAEKLAKQLVQRSPQDLKAQTLYLHALVLNDDEDLARPLAKRLFAVAPHDFTVLYLNGVLENRSGNYRGARDFLEKAVALSPNDYNAHYNLGLALANLNDLQGARGEFEKALAMGASEPAVRDEYVKVLHTLGETKLAEEQLKLYQQEQKAQADRTQAAISGGQGDKALAEGDPKKAVDLYRDAIAALPDNALLHFKLSVALDKVGDTAGEREALQKAVQIDPTMAIAHRQLGYLSFNDADFATAEAQFRKAVEAAPAFADAWVSLAATLATESRPSEAVEAVQHALQIDPHNANALALQKELSNAAAGQSNQ